MEEIQVPYEKDDITPKEEKGLTMVVKGISKRYPFITGYQLIEDYKKCIDYCYEQNPDKKYKYEDTITQQPLNDFMYIFLQKENEILHNENKQLRENKKLHEDNKQLHEDNKELREEYHKLREEYHKLQEEYHKLQEEYHKLQ